MLSDRMRAMAVLMGSLLLTALYCPAEVYATREEALKIIFAKPDRAKEEVKMLSPPQRESLQRESRLHFPEQEYRFLRGNAKDGSEVRALVMNEIGKSERITFMVGIAENGRVTDVVVMEFRESRGWEVKEKRFTSQFRGRKAKDPVRVHQDIMNYTGATLSSEAIARGVKKALLLNELFYGSGEQ